MRCQLDVAEFDLPCAQGCSIRERGERVVYEYISRSGGTWVVIPPPPPEKKRTKGATTTWLHGRRLKDPHYLVTPVGSATHAVCKTHNKTTMQQYNHAVFPDA